MLSEVENLKKIQVKKIVLMTSIFLVIGYYCGYAIAQKEKSTKTQALSSQDISPTKLCEKPGTSFSFQCNVIIISSKDKSAFSEEKHYEYEIDIHDFLGFDCVPNGACSGRNKTIQKYRSQ